VSTLKGIEKSGSGVVIRKDEEDAKQILLPSDSRDASVGGPSAPLFASC
jgi:hypothetical protein